MFDKPSPGSHIDRLQKAAWWPLREAVIRMAGGLDHKLGFHEACEKTKYHGDPSTALEAAARDLKIYTKKRELLEMLRSGKIHATGYFEDSLFPVRYFEDVPTPLRYSEKSPVLFRDKRLMGISPFQWQTIDTQMIDYEQNSIEIEVQINGKFATLVNSRHTICYINVQPFDCSSSEVGIESTESECASYLVKLMRNPNFKGPKKAALKEVRKLWGRDKLSDRAFNRAWGAAATETGRHDLQEPGRKRERS